MASKAQVAQVDPLSVVLLDNNVTLPGILLMSTAWRPEVLDIVTVLILADGSPDGLALVLGLWS